MILDPIAAVLCGVLSLCVFTLHVISSPRRKIWMTLPEYLRRGLLVTGVMFTWRSVNFATIHDMQPAVRGHINVEGMMALVAITYTGLALTVWALRKALPGLGWERLAWLEKRGREGQGELIPVPMEMAEVEELAKAQGFYVNGQPPAETKH